MSLDIFVFPSFASFSFLHNFKKLKACLERSCGDPDSSLLWSVCESKLTVSEAKCRRPDVFSSTRLVVRSIRLHETHLVGLKNTC